MSGHSKWHKIRHTKAATDKKKSKEFGKAIREIQSAIGQGGNDPNKNISLRDAIARAKKANVPQANIDRALAAKNKGNLEEIIYEAFGPSGSGLILKASTDNPNRTVSEIRNILKNHGGSLGEPNSVRWKFNDRMEPAYPLELDAAGKQTITSLIQELTEHPDITTVHTDIKLETQT